MCVQRGLAHAETEPHGHASRERTPSYDTIYLLRTVPDSVGSAVATPLFRTWPCIRLCAGCTHSAFCLLRPVERGVPLALLIALRFHSVSLPSSCRDRTSNALSSWWSMTAAPMIGWLLSPRNPPPLPALEVSMVGFVRLGCCAARRAPDGGATRGWPPTRSIHASDGSFGSLASRAQASRSEGATSRVWAASLSRATCLGRPRGAASGGGRARCAVGRGRPPHRPPCQRPAPLPRDWPPSPGPPRTLAESGASGSQP